MGNRTYVLRMGLLIAAAALGALALQRALRPEGYGQLGSYRVDSLAEIASREPVHQGKAACQECHAEICTLHGKDIHFGVQCEDCHGPGNLHVRFHREKDPAIPASRAAMPREYTLEGCLFCHRKLAARPRTFPQVDPIEHFQFLKVNGPETRCIDCHSPHEPLFLLTAVDEARIHPVIHECSDCHDAQPEKDHREVAGHPVIFLCRDCHAEVTADFESREHAFLRCTACHLFHRENETAGRIFKNGNKKFCLLCHEDKPFKDHELLGMVEAEKHIADTASRAKKDPQALKDDPRACLACHLPFVHDPALMQKKSEPPKE